MKFQRTTRIARREDTPAENQEIEIAISSEEPYERWWGIEILDHKANSIDLSRLSDNRHPLLLDHDTRKQIGVLRGAAVGDDQVLRCIAKFSRGELGQEILQDVQDEIRTMVSVGYSVDEVEEEKALPDGSIERRKMSGEQFQREMTTRHGADWAKASGTRAGGPGDTTPVYRVTRWCPFEASIVSIPADPTVGVGRAGGPAGLNPAGSDREAGSPTVPEASRTNPGGHTTAAAPDTTVGNRTVDPPAAPAPAISAAAAPAFSGEKIMSEAVQKTPAELERERTSNIISMGDQYKKYVDQKDIANACRNGHSVEQFRELVMTKMETRHSTTQDVEIGMTKKEVGQYSLVRAILASATGDWSGAGLEREASEAVSKIYGRGPEGFYVPFEAFSRQQRDFNVGTSTEAGNLVATDLRTDLYVDALRNNLVMARMGMRMLPGLTSSIAIPRKSSVATIGTLSEIGSQTEGNPTIAQITLSPKRLGAYVEYSKQALIQSSMALEPMLRDDLISGAAVLMESQVINGVGSSNQMTGIRTYSGIGTTTAGTNAAVPAWSHFIDLESAVANNNAEPDSLAGYLINTRTRGKLKQTTKGTYLGFIWDSGAQPLNGYRAMVTNNLANNLTKGTSTTICSAALFSSDWSMGVIGLFGAPDVTVDPYTLAVTGQVRITLNQFADFGLRQPAAFSKIDDLLSN